jgi:Glycerophosphoryl diester phosphodiesterase family
MSFSVCRNDLNRCYIAMRCVIKAMKGGLVMLALNLVVGLAPAMASRSGKVVEGYIVSLPSESSAERQARLHAVALRRAGSVLIVHRGAAAFAPENTLAAYAAAMDYGADGCEMDIRRTADGVLVMLHDDGLERMTSALGRVNQYTCRQLAALKFRPRYHAKPGTRIPTLAAVFELARQRAMLLHLDIKEPGLQEQIAKLLDAGDMWDQVVSINNYNSAALRRNPKFKPLAYKAPGLDDGRLDMDPAAVRAALAKPGNMIMVDDPRVGAWILKRAVHHVPLPGNLRAPLPPARVMVAPNTGSFSPPQFLQALSQRIDRRSVRQLGKLLTAEFSGRDDLGGNAAYQRHREARIVERAWAAERIGQLGVKSPRRVRWLDRLIARRSLHRDWAYQGLDGVMAVRALGALGATSAVPMLVKTFLGVDPELKKMVQPRASYPYAWADFKLKSEIMDTLGRLRCRRSTLFLRRYLAMDQATAGKFAPPLFEQATRSLLEQAGLTEAQLEALLRSPNSAVRGTAILECLDHPTPARAAALRAVQPWAAGLPRADPPRRRLAIAPRRLLQRLR